MLTVTAKVRPAIRSVSQVFFLCNCIAPFIYHLSKNPDLLGEILQGIYLCLESPELQAALTRPNYWDIHMQNLDLFNEAKQFEIVVDFLHHCKHVFKLKQEHHDKWHPSLNIFKLQHI